MVTITTWQVRDSDSSPGSVHTSIGNRKLKTDFYFVLQCYKPTVYGNRIEQLYFIWKFVKNASLRTEVQYPHQNTTTFIITQIPSKLPNMS